MPGPPCIAKIPILAPLVERLMPSAMPTPTRSWRQIIGLEPGFDARIDQELARIADEILHAFGHEHARDRFGDFHANPPFVRPNAPKIGAVRKRRPGS